MNDIEAKELDQRVRADIKVILAKAEKLGLREGRIAFMNANDPLSKLFPLSECLALALKLSFRRVYEGGRSGESVMLAANFGHWHKDEAHWGDPTGC